MASRDEILRFMAQVEGKEKVDAMGDSFDALGDAAKNADPKAEALLDNIERLTNTGKAVSGFVKLKAQLQETGDNLFLARQRTKELETQFSATLEPTAKLTKQLERSRAEVARLATEQNRQTAALQRAENTIKAAGYDLNQLARAEADVRDKTVQATAAAREYATELTRTGRVATNTGGAFTKLRGIVAGLFAGLSIRGAAEGVKDILMLGDAAERTRNQFTQLYGSQAAGDRARAALEKFADRNAQSLDTTREAAVKLKAFGIDPLAGSLQSLVDENAAMGGSQERLEGTILAVGQAWAKQKLQGEEILQLVERGVPVWELLSKVTGKNVQELQKLSEQGKLGRKEISALLAEIGKMNSGAAAKNASTLSGLFTQLSSRVRQFFTEVSNGGPLDYFKQQMRDAIALVDRLSKTNELATWARKFGETIVQTGQAIVGTGKFIAEHIDLILTLGKAYAAVKFGNFLAGLASIGPAAAGATKGLGSLSAAAARLPGGIQIAIALLGLELAIKGANELGDAIGRNAPATKAWEERTRQLNAQTREAAERFLQATASLNQYRDVQLKSSDAVSVLTAAERTRYAEGIDGLERYLKSQVAYYDSLRQIGQLNNEGLQHLAALRARLTEVEAAAKTLNATAAIAADTLNAKLSEGARLLVKDLDSAGASSKKLGESLGKAFATIETDTVTKIGDIGLAVATVARQSETAGRALQAGLGDALRQISGEELLKFQSSSIAAFESVGLGIKDTAIVLDTTLLVGLEKLGVAPEKFALGMSAAGTQAVATFQTIIENARATGEQIEAAFVSATRAVSSTEDVKALGDALKVAADQGRISLEGAERAGFALQNRIREIAAVTDPLGDSFARLGIKSQAALNATRDSAREAFQAIADGAKRGEASQYDVQRAFEAYAATARDAVRNANDQIREQVELQLQAEAAAVNVKIALIEVGDAGENAGKRTAAGAREATAALEETSSSADKAASSAENLGQSSNKAAGGLQNAATAGNAAAESAINVSREFANASTTILGLDRVAFNVATDEEARARRRLEAVQQQIAKYDELTQRVESLRGTYKTLGDEQLRQLAAADMQLEQLERRAKEEKARNQDASGSSSSSGGAGGIDRNGTLTIEFARPRQVDADALLADSVTMDKLTRAFGKRLESLADRGGFRFKRG